MVWEISSRGGQLYVSGVFSNDDLTCRSGWSAISPDERLIVLSDLPNGFECYTVSDQQRVFAVHLAAPESIPTSVIFAPNGSIVFGGSSGAAYIASGIPPEINQALEYESKSYLWVEASGVSIILSKDEPEVAPILVSSARHLVVSPKGLIGREASIAYTRRTHFLAIGTYDRGGGTAIRVWEGTIEGDGFRWLEGPVRFLGSVRGSLICSTCCLTIR